MDVELTPEIEALLQRGRALLLPEDPDWESDQSVSLRYYDPELDAHVQIDLNVSVLGRKPWKRPEDSTCPRCGNEPH